MKKGYWVVAYQSISDESAVKSYAALARPALESFGARLLTSSTSQIQHSRSRVAATDDRCRVRQLSRPPWQLTIVRLTKRRFRHWDRAQSVTSASSREYRPRQNSHIVVHG